jgi:type I restriction enzyme S subunit
MIPMPERNSVSEVIARAASKCLRIACERLFDKSPIGTVASVVSGGTPDTANPSYWGGEVVWVTPKDLGRPRNIEVDSSERHLTAEAVSRSSARILPAGTVLLSSRAPIGHLGIAAQPLATNQGFKNIICGPHLNNRYLFHVLRSRIDELNGLGRGNTFREIPARIVNDFLIPLPPLNTQAEVAAFMDGLYLRLAGCATPLPRLPGGLDEQRRIVSRIEEFAAKDAIARELRNASIQATATLVDAEIQRLFSSGSKNQWNSGYLGDYVLDDCYGTSEKTNDDVSGTPILRMGNIQAGRLDTTTLKYLRLRDRDRKKWILQRGDILVNRTNSAELVGKCVVFDIEGEYGFASYIIRLRLDATRALPRLVAAYINSPIGRAYMFSERKQMTGQANINSQKLKALPIALPRLSEQERILGHLSELSTKLDALRRLQSETATKLDSLMPSVLSKAFRGEL